MATQLLANVDENWTNKRIGILLRLGRRMETSDMQFHVGRQDIMFHSKSNSEQIIRDLIEEAEKWDLAPASLWWTSTHVPEERCDLSFDTKSGRHKFPFDADSRSWDVR